MVKETEAPGNPLSYDEMKNTYSIQFKGNDDLSQFETRYLSVQPRHETVSLGDTLKGVRSLHTSYVVWWDYEIERSLWTTEFHDSNTFIIKHRWHGWARAHNKNIELFENNSYLALDVDKYADRDPNDPLHMYLHVTTKREDALVWRYDAYIDPREETLRQYKQKIDSEQSKQSKIMDIQEIF